MLSNLLEALAFAWLIWIFGNLLLLVASAWLAKPDHPCFNGFKIVIPTWLHETLTPAEVAAVIAHEEGHKFMLHVWENFGLVCVFSNVTVERRHEQEIEADDFAVAAGHALALASALVKLSNQPSAVARAERILRMHC